MTTRKRLRELLGDQAGVIRPGLQPLYDALADAERPATVEAWLNKDAAPAILRQLAGNRSRIVPSTSSAAISPPCTCVLSWSRSERCPNG